VTLAVVGFKGFALPPAYFLGREKTCRAAPGGQPLVAVPT
jgi:hypothetical protein